MKAIWELLRLEHGIMYAFGVLSGIIVSSGFSFSIEKAIFGMLAAIFLQASGFALNDYIDYEVDLANKRMDRPIVRGDVSRKTALILSLALFPIGLIFAYLVNFEAFVFALAVSLLGYAYDLKLKEFGIVGNVYIAFSMAVPFLFGSIVAENEISGPVLLLSSLAFFSGIGREIMKGIEDITGDAIRNVRSVARIKGVEFAAKLASLFFILAVFLSFIPPLIYRRFANPGYVIPVLITDFLLIKSSFKLLKRVDACLIRELRKETLVAMGFGLIGFIAGAVL